MILGESCGIGAALSLAAGAPLHQVPTKKLRALLEERGQVVDASPFNDFWPKKRTPPPKV